MLINKKLFFYFIIGIISIVIISFFCYLAKYTSFFGDDFVYTRYYMSESLFNSLNPNGLSGHGSGYIGLFLCKFISTKLPNILGINSWDFLNTGANFIRGIITVCILLYISKFVNIFNKAKFWYVYTFVFLSFYFFFVATNSMVIHINYNFYRYFLSLFFYGFFWFNIYQFIAFEANNNDTYYKKIGPPPHKHIYKYKKLLSLILLLLVGYSIGNSIEILFFASAFMSVLIILYNILCFKYKDNKYRLGYIFYVPVIYLFTAIYMFTNTSAFKIVANDRGMNDININLDVIKEFTFQFLQSYVYDYIAYYIIFFCVLFVSFSIAFKNNEIKKIIFPIFMQLANIVTIFSLILCGKTYSNTIENNVYYIIHPNIKFLYSILIIFPLLILISYVTNYFENRPNKKVIKDIKIFFISALTVFIIIFFCCLKIKIASCHVYMKSARQSGYIIEKIIRFYDIHNKTAIIPKAISLTYYQELYLRPHISAYIKSFYNNYKDSNIYNTGLVMEYDGLEKFYAEGGVITKSELEKINFGNLNDRDFVLSNNYNDVCSIYELKEKFINRKAIKANKELFLKDVKIE